MRILCLSMAFLLAAVTGLQAETKTLRIATGIYKPFTGPDLPDHGVVNANIVRIAKRAGFDVRFDYMPWKRAIEVTRRGAYDATSYWYHSEARNADFIHVGPVMKERLIFLTCDENATLDWERLEDLAGLRIGVVPGYTYTEELWDLAERGILTLSEGPSDEANLRKLLAGRIDLYPVTEGAGWHLIRHVFFKAEQERFMALRTPLAITEGYLLVPRKARDADAIAEALQNAVAAN